MKVLLIKIFSFLIGLFIIISLIYYIYINRKIELFYNETTPPPATTPTPPPVSNDISKTITEGPNTITTTTFKYKEDNELNNNIIEIYKNKIISISSYYDNISITNLKWYDDDIDINKITSTDTKLPYFKFTNINDKPKSKPLPVNIGELIGPNAMDLVKDNKLKEFTAIFIIKINELKNENNILFEILGDTISIKNTQTNKDEYITSTININLIKKSINPNTFDIELIIGNITYNTTLIPPLINNIITSTYEYITLGLTYNKNKIVLILNENYISYKNLSNYDISLSATPIKINKENSINCNLYNFRFYNRVLSNDELSYIKAYSNYYIHGAYYKDEIIKKEKDKNEATIKALKIETDKQIASSTASASAINYVPKCSGGSCDIKEIPKLELSTNQSKDVLLPITKIFNSSS